MSLICGSKSTGERWPVEAQQAEYRGYAYGWQSFVVDQTVETVRPPDGGLGSPLDDLVSATTLTNYSTLDLVGRQSVDRGFQHKPRAVTLDQTNSTRGRSLCLQQENLNSRNLRGGSVRCWDFRLEDRRHPRLCLRLILLRYERNQGTTGSATRGFCCSRTPH